MAGSIAKAYVQIIPSAEGIKGKLSSTFNNEMPSAGESAGGVFGSNLVSKIKGLIAAAGIGKMLSESIQAGAAMEQSLGGIETLFKDSADIVIKNAEQAYKTAGMSANEYMESVTSFSASLLQGLSGDTKAAASIADMALTDMSDNANKMGTSMESIQNAYQGFAKQNYTMLDNLKLGYGGTKTEMERLLADAQKLTGVEYDISNLADVYSAIHAIQEEMDITGTTAKESAATISGSFASMKAAFSDVMANLALGRDLGPSLNALADTAVTFLVDNLLPAVWNIVSSLPGALVTFVKGLLPSNLQDLASTGVSQLSTFISENLPVIFENGVQTVVNLADGFLQGIPGFLEVAGGMLDKLLSALTDAWPKIMESGFSLNGKLADGMLSNIPAIVSAVSSIVSKLLAKLASNLPQMLQQGFSLITELAVGFLKAIPKVIEAIPQIIDTVKETFGQFDWKEIGLNIVKGIANGITAAAGAIWEAAKQAASNALSAAKKALGIASPSRVMRDEVGKFIPAGIAEGIQDNVKPVSVAIHDLTSLTTDTLHAELRPDSLKSYVPEQKNSYGNTSFTINVYGSPGQSVDELANAVMQKIQFEVARREAQLS